MKGVIQLPTILLIVLISGGAIVSYQLLSKNSPNLPQQSLQPTTTPSPIASPPPSVQPSSLPIIPIIRSTPSPMPTVTPSPTPNNINSSVHIDSIFPSSGKVGDTTVIKGSGFGKSSFYFPDPTKFLGMVSFYGPSGQNSGGAPSACTEDWDYSCWSDNQIKVKVPGVKPGFTFQVGVTSADGQKSNRVNFQVLGD